MTDPSGSSGKPVRLATTRLALAVPLDIPGSLGGLQRWGDDLMDRWDASRWLRVLRIAGMGESAVEELVEPVYARWKQHPVTILASPGEVQLHLYVRGEPAFAHEAEGCCLEAPVACNRRNP